MSNKFVRILFITALVFLPLQYGMVGIAGYYHSEPWPAFVFPGFKNVYVVEDAFEIPQTRFEVFAAGAGEPVVLAPQELFPEIPLSQTPGFVRTHFSDAGKMEAFSPEARQWLLKQVAAAAGFEPELMDVVQRTKYYSHGADGAVRDSVAEQARTRIDF